MRHGDAAPIGLMRILHYQKGESGQGKWWRQRCTFEGLEGLKIKIRKKGLGGELH